MDYDQKVEELAIKIHELFVANERRYAEQLDDGSYNTLYKSLHPYTIKNMLIRGKSYLTYQESKGYVKWLCLDFDIIKSAYDVDGFASHAQELLKSVSKAVNFLERLKIDFLLECSGRRGFHIWIIFESFLSKASAFSIVDAIERASKCSSENIEIDKYPKTGTINKKSKGIGLGVKLPLALHRISGKRSHLVTDITKFSLDRDTWPQTLSEELICSHLDIINNYKKQQEEILKDKLSIIDEVAYNRSELFERVSDATLPEKTSLDSILQKLRGCKKIEPILKRYQKGLSNREREIMVGLLCRFRTETDNDYGKKLLKEFFSRTPNYKPNLTEKKLARLRYYPLSCKYLGDGRCGEQCNANFKSPIDFISNAAISYRTDTACFDFLSKDFEKIVEAQKNYSYFNDEIPLYTTEKHLESLRYTDAANVYKKVIENNNKMEFGVYYSFERLESADKKRMLYSLNAQDKVVTTLLINILHTFFSEEISDNSFGYQHANSFAGNEIFYHWLRQWKRYITHISELVEEDSYEDHILLKIDLKRFYENIDHKRLALKLQIESTSRLVSELNDVDKKRYSNIVTYLINICKHLMGEKRGVPQGPAFARYLAEIYLIDLDRQIEEQLKKGIEFYYRYVDDIFIFLRGKEKALNIYNLIKRQLNIHGLSINTSKEFIGTVKKYRESGELKNYYESAKYLIDRTDKSLAVMTENDILEAVRDMNDLSKSIEFNDNLRFFFTHLKENDIVKGGKSSLEKKIISSKFGRGALYRIFYEYFFDKYKHGHPEELSQLVIKTSGLALTGYLNTLLRFVDKRQLDIQHFEKVLMQLAEKKDLSTVDKELLLLLLLKASIELPDHFLESVESTIIYRVAIAPLAKHLPEKVTTLILSHLEKEENFKCFLKELLLVLIANKITKSELSNFCSYFFTRATEYIKPLMKKRSNFIENEEDFNDYYSLVCALTPFYNTDHDGLKWENVTSIWEDLLKIVTVNIDVKNIKHSWLKILSHIPITDFSPQTLSLLITTNIPGSRFSYIEDPHHLWINFLMYFLLLLFRKSKDHGKLNSYLRKHDLEQNIRNKLAPKSKLIKWMLDKSVSLFPQDDSGLENITENNITVLQKGNKYLINLYEHKCMNFDYINMKKYKDELFPETYQILVEKDNDFKRISELIKECNNDGIEILKLLVEFYVHTNYFRERYTTTIAEKFPNIFHNDSYVYTGNKKEYLYFPLLPFFALGEKLVIFSSDTKKNLMNNQENFCYLLLEKMFNNAISLLTKNESHPYFSNSKEDSFDKRFFPGGRVLTKSDYVSKVLFLTYFTQLFSEREKPTAYYFEYALVTALVKYIQREKKEDEYRPISLFLNAYHDRGSNRTTKTKLLFAVEKLEPSKDNFFLFFNSIKESVSAFHNQVGVSEEDKGDLLKLLKDEEEEINDILKETLDLKIGLECFKYASVKHEKKENFKTRDNEHFLVINGEYVSFNNHTFKILKLSNKYLQFQELKPEDLYLVINNRGKYYHEYNGNVYIIESSPELEKAYETIVSRKKKFFHYINEAPSHRNLQLFINTNYITDLVEDFPGYSESILKAFTHHYYDTDLSENYIKTRIANWLWQFNAYSLRGSKLRKYMDTNYFKLEDLYRTILNILKVHNYIDEDDVNDFKKNLAKLRQEDSLFFPIKSFFDGNGLSRLIVNIKENRDEIFADCIEKVCNKSKNQNKLVIMTDISISGTQTNNAFGYYLKQFQTEVDLNKDVKGKDIDKKKLHYYKFESLKQAMDFQACFLEINEIIFLTALATKQYQVGAQTNIIDFFKKNNTPLPKFSTCSRRHLEKDEWIYNDCNINPEHRSLFNVFITDYDLIEKVFSLSKDKLEAYKESTRPREIKRTNMLLRISSVPKMHFKIFSLEQSFEPINKTDPKRMSLFERME
jgi:hypothetical protein